MTTHFDENNVIRMDHYGLGKQPWDLIVEHGWGAAFAGGNILKYLRRTKDREHSLESARWYWRRLNELGKDCSYSGIEAVIVKAGLLKMLTPKEISLLEQE